MENVVNRHADDPADRLGEQQNKAGSDPNSQRGAAVVEDPLQGGDPLVLTHRVGVRGRTVRDGQPRHPAAVHAPPQERLCGSSGGVLLRVPGIEVGLGAGAERDVAAKPQRSQKKSRLAGHRWYASVLCKVTAELPERPTRGQR
ncbi:hypothetical protein ACH4VS_36240 [Streptomyces hygroscopicus]|uniref:hypothetical protein n=1 Tax=Streptomyces hygroscopicus TaxID=1912 RepID=UPI001180F058|nr:hypothetical protein [Streptomyces hygroscopicus]GLV78923.1 hypothetical protein Shyhy02_69230 [Streptomyces hygroscopicus subsp. hygroscopicus]